MTAPAIDAFFWPDARAWTQASTSALSRPKLPSRYVVRVRMNVVITSEALPSAHSSVSV